MVDMYEPVERDKKISLRVPRGGEIRKKITLDLWDPKKYRLKFYEVFLKYSIAGISPGRVKVVINGKTVFDRAIKSTSRVGLTIAGTRFCTAPSSPQCNAINNSTPNTVIEIEASNPNPEHDANLELEIKYTLEKLPSGYIKSSGISFPKKEECTPVTLTLKDVEYKVITEDHRTTEIIKVEKLNLEQAKARGYFKESDQFYEFYVQGHDTFYTQSTSVNVSATFHINGSENSDHFVIIPVKVTRSDSAHSLVASIGSGTKDSRIEQIKRELKSDNVLPRNLPYLLYLADKPFTTSKDVKFILLKNQDVFFSSYPESAYGGAVSGWIKIPKTVYVKPISVEFDVMTNVPAEVKCIHSIPTGYFNQRMCDKALVDVDSSFKQKLAKWKHWFGIIGWYGSHEYGTYRSASIFFELPARVEVRGNRIDKHVAFVCENVKEIGLPVTPPPISPPIRPPQIKADHNTMSLLMSTVPIGLLAWGLQQRW